MMPSASSESPTVYKLLQLGFIAKGVHGESQAGVRGLRLAPPLNHLCRVLFLGDEAEGTAEPSVVLEVATVTIPAHQRQLRGRKPLPEFIERVELLHDLPEAEKVCPHDGTRLERIGEETSEQLDIIPAQVRVLRYVRPKYACPCCRQGVKTAKLPPQPIPRSIASHGLLAYVATAKYVDGLPLYWLEAILQRTGIAQTKAIG